MKSRPKRLFHLIGFVLLVSLSCSAPFQSLIQSNQPPDDSQASEGNPDPSASVTIIPHNTDGAEVTYIPGGTYLMGSAASDELADEDEFPQHQVTVSDFFIYTGEVSNQMYSACVEAGYCISPQVLESGPSSHYEDQEYADHPVVNVDWLMARDYCNWAGARLPTEAEWELTSRSTENYQYPWGEDEPDCTLVNMGGCLVPPDTQPAGFYLLGNSSEDVWDMSGNVWEWTHDWYADDYYSQSPEHNPIGPQEPQDPDMPLRAIRGGGLNSGPEKMRSAYRMGLNPHRPYTDVGFRCVTGQDLSLPAAYDPGEEYHERVPPDRADGGDSADDDPGEGGFIRAGEIFGPCPDGSGTLRLVVPVSASDPIREMMTRFEGDHWDPDCEHDPATDTAICEGPEPAGYMTIPPPSFPLDICIDIVYTGICFEDMPVWKPTDCEDPDEGTEFEVEARAGCLDTETTAIVAYFTPEDAPFGSASTDMLLLDCIPLPEEGYYRCNDLPGSPGDLVDVHFTTADGRSDTVSVTIPECSVSMRADAFCLDDGFDRIPAMTLEFFGVSAGFTGAMADGIDMVCEDDGTSILCTEFSGLPGELLMVIASFDTGATLAADAIFPDCGSRPSSGSMRVEPRCVDIGGISEPRLILHFSDIGSDFVDASVGSHSMDCTDLGGDIYSCECHVCEAGDPLLVLAILDSGFVHAGFVDFPDCSGPVGFLDPWTLVEVGCHSEVEYYGVIDTDLDEVFTGWRLEDVPEPKTCGEQPGRAGYWYCNFPINDWYTTLTFCADWVGSAGEYCETFPSASFADRLPASCSTGGDPGEEDPCSEYNQTECTSGPNANFCTWNGSECVSN